MTPSDAPFASVLKQYPQADLVAASRKIQRMRAIAGAVTLTGALIIKNYVHVEGASIVTILPMIPIVRGIVTSIRSPKRLHEDRTVVQAAIRAERRRLKKLAR